MTTRSETLHALAVSVAEQRALAAETLALAPQTEKTRLARERLLEPL